MTESIKEKSNKIKNNSHMTLASRLNSQIITTLVSDIQSDKLAINQKKVQIDINSHKTDISSEKLHQIVVKKQSMEKQLHNLQQQQFKLKHHNSLPHIVKTIRSQFTQEQIQQIKRIRQTQKRFQQELQQKTSALQEKIKKEKQQEIQLLQKQKQQKTKQRKQQIQKRLLQLEHKREQRQAQLLQQKRNMMQLKNRRRLYQQMDSKFKKFQQDQQLKKKVIQQESKKNQTFNVDKIKQHARKYQQIIQNQREKRQKKFLQNSEVFNLKASQFKPTRFMNLVVQEQQKRKEFQQKKKKARLANVQKQKQYAQYVKQHRKPQLKQILEAQKPSQTRQTSVKSLTALQLYRKGNQYMHQAHSNINFVKVSDSKVNQILTAKPQKTAFKYKNYLQQIKLARTANSMGKTNRDLDQIKKIMRKQNQTHDQKLYKAKMIANKLESRMIKGTNPSNLVQSINAKIQIIKELSQ